MNFPAIKTFVQLALKINIRNLIIVFLISLLFRLTLGLPNLIHTENAFTGDSNGYLMLAGALQISVVVSAIKSGYMGVRNKLGKLNCLMAPASIK